MRARRSTTPRNPLSAPIGAWIATGRGENSRRPSIARPKSAFSLSILLITIRVGVPRWRSWCQASSVPTTTPLFALNTRSAPSAAESALQTSPVKSWNPGVSSRLIFVSCQVRWATLVPMEILRLVSSGSKSKTVVPASGLPSRSTAPPA